MMGRLGGLKKNCKEVLGEWKEVGGIFKGRVKDSR